MGKLITLLNEYDPPREGEPMREYSDFISYNGMCKDYSELLCLSKRYGFIEWLVYKDKIEGPKIREKNPYIIDTLNDYTDLYSYEKLLMLLAIQDNPIDFLVSILK